jgi:hypothetical protein
MSYGEWRMSYGSYGLYESTLPRAGAPHARRVHTHPRAHHQSTPSDQPIRSPPEHPIRAPSEHPMRAPHQSTPSAHHRGSIGAPPEHHQSTPSDHHLRNPREHPIREPSEHNQKHHQRHPIRAPSEHYQSSIRAPSHLSDPIISPIRAPSESEHRRSTIRARTTCEATRTGAPSPRTPRAGTPRSHMQRVCALDAAPTSTRARMHTRAPEQIRSCSAAPEMRRSPCAACTRAPRVHI